MKKASLFSLLPLLVALASCHSLGPDTIEAVHPLYNDAIVRTVESQFLSNLVRLRYRDTPYFLDVTSITNSVNLQMSGGSNGSQISLDSVASNYLSVDVGGSWSTTPTITFQPVEGEGFVRKFLTPITLDSLVLLVQSGWSLQRVFGVCVEQINGIRNAVTASGPTPKTPPLDYQRYSRLLTLLEMLRTDDAIRVSVDPVNKEVRMELRPTPSTELAVIELKSMLDLDPNTEVFQLTSDLVHQTSKTIALRTRSPLSVLFSLSQSVEAPEEHVKAGLVTITRNADGTPFPWSHTPAGSRFTIHSSDTRPTNAFIQVPYRNHWYYLEDSDLESKSSFMLMTQVFRLQAGTVNSVPPVLTIPVAK